jgi:hypothetical protein
LNAGVTRGGLANPSIGSVVNPATPGFTSIRPGYDFLLPVPDGEDLILSGCLTCSVVCFGKQYADVR